jgi:DMSO/TMAO reductase YedYZ molybdopterin-dependent catalytic subunit
LRTSVGLIGGLSILGAFGTMGAQVLAAARPRAGSAKLPADSFGPTPAQTPVGDFYVVAKDLLPPSVDTASWRLSVDGLVDRPGQFGLDDLRGLPVQHAYRTLECISTQIVAGDHLIGNQRWTGARIADLLDRVGVQPGAKWVLWEAADGYTEAIELDVARDPESWIAYEMADAPIPAEHGHPARVLIAGRFGMKQPKWVTAMHLAAARAPGFWEERGWDDQAIERTMSRIDLPSPGDEVPAGRPFRTYGIAFAGDRGVSKVEVSADGAKTWTVAELEPERPPIGPLTWVRWRADVSVPTAGAAQVTVRATDGRGQIQERRVVDALPSGSTGWHTVRVFAVEGV